MRVLGIVGSSGMGKTTLLERLIPELVQRGLRVSLIKLSQKDIELDAPGKDSHRLRIAGCHDVAVVGTNRWGVVHELRNSPQPALEDLLAAMRPCDLVLVEGMKSDAFPKLEVWRVGLGKPPLQRKGTLAVITDAARVPEVPLGVLSLADTMAVADFVEDYTRNGWCMDPSPCGPGAEPSRADWPARRESNPRQPA